MEAPALKSHFKSQKKRLTKIAENEDLNVEQHNGEENGVQVMEEEENEGDSNDEIDNLF